MIRKHRIRECSRNSNHHPPYNPNQKVLPLPSYQTRNQRTIHSRNLQRYQGPDDQEYAVADQQPELFTSPSWYANPQQPKQVLKELPIQLHLLPLCRFAMSQYRRTPLSLLCLSYSRSFLFRDGGSYAVEEGEEEGKVDGPRYLRAVLEV